MLINYHYFTVKTLARYAGLEEKTAQFIAYFSQYVDDYIIRKPFIVDREPPGFFLKNGLAAKLSKNRWVFAPCPTGFSLFNSRSHDYQLHTLMPFHFILRVPLFDLPQNANRNCYRCVIASQNDKLLINRLLQESVKKVDLKDKTSLMALGMMIHIFADTYSHNGFSGFHGWENEFYIAGLEATCPWLEKSYSSYKLRDPLPQAVFSPKAPNCHLSLAEKYFFRTLPSIGHCNADSVTDHCERKILLHAKRHNAGQLEHFIERDNSETFADCSKQILDLFCKINGKSALNDADWQELRLKLAKAQDITRQGNIEANKKIWPLIFPDISYHYHKNEFFKIKLQHDKHKNRKLLDKLDVDRKELSDPYSEEGDQARAVFPMIAKNVNDLFFSYNELAYKHVFIMTGEYLSPGSIELISNYRKFASQSKAEPTDYDFSHSR